MKRKIQGPHGLLLVLDTEEVFPNDPGAGTPAVVHWRGASSTYWCAMGTGELLSYRDGVVLLTDAQMDWLCSERVENEVHQFLYPETTNA